MDDTRQAPPRAATDEQPRWAPDDPGRMNTEHLTDYRQLRRSHDDRKIGGVAGGLGRHLDVDPTILRVLFVVALFFGGAGLLVYTALWLVVPDDRTGRSVFSVRDTTRNVLVLVVLVLAALVAVGDTLDGSVAWPPLVLIALVAFVWLMARDRRRGEAADAPAPPTRWSAPPPATWADTTTEPTSAASSDPVVGSAGGPGGSGGAPTAPYPVWTPPAPRPRRRRRPGPLLIGVTLALVAVALGVVGLVEASGVAVTDGAYPAAAVAVVGLMLVVGSFYGRPGGLILLGVLSVLALSVTSVAQPGFRGDRDLLVRPVSADRLDPSYAVPAGRMEVDLTRVRDLDALDGRTLRLSSNAGEVLVVVPDGLAVDLRADVAYGGSVDWPGGTRGGWDFGRSVTVGDEDDPTIRVDADVDFGHIQVRTR